MPEILLALFLFALIYGGLIREHREQEDRRRKADEFNGMVVRITGGTGSGQERTVLAYDGTTKVASVFEFHMFTIIPSFMRLQHLIRRHQRAIIEMRAATAIYSGEAVCCDSNGEAVSVNTGHNKAKREQILNGVLEQVRGMGLDVQVVEL